MGAFGDPARAGHEARRRHPARGPIPARPLRQLPPRALPGRPALPLKRYGARDVDFVVFRENTEGSYVGSGGNFKKGTPDEVAVQEDISTRKGVERIVRYAFEFARGRGAARARHVGQVQRDALRRRPVAAGLRRGRAEYPDIESSTSSWTPSACRSCKDPRQFDVIVTNNMFGDIVTDLGAALQGGLGMAASGNIHPGRVSMFEPVHGSAPKYAGTGRANPFGAILTVAAHARAPGQAARKRRPSSGRSRPASGQKPLHGGRRRRADHRAGGRCRRREARW